MIDTGVRLISVSHGINVIEVRIFVTILFKSDESLPMEIERKHVDLCKIFLSANEIMYTTARFFANQSLWIWNFMRIIGNLK